MVNRQDHIISEQMQETLARVNANETGVHDFTSEPETKIESDYVDLSRKERIFQRIGSNKFGFHAKVLDCTIEPQKITYLKMHQCYHHMAVFYTKLDETECGEIIVKRLLEGNRGHYSPLEGATITIAFEGVCHSTLQQLLRSRIGVSPSVQSFRYTSQQILKCADGKLDLEDLIYLRPVGEYHDRERSYNYTAETREEDISLAKFCVAHVAKRLKEGMPPEQARGMLPFDYRQHFNVTLNARSLMGILDRRSKKDAQAEIQVLATLLNEIFLNWMPEVANWYQRQRLGKAILAP